MLPNRRQDEIVKLLTEHGALPLRDLAAQVGVSEATARRDVNRLADAGRLSRVYGGAVINGPAEEPFDYSDVTDRDQKKNIARAAAKLVSDGDAVVLDIGSTVLELSHLLAGRPITVITSNLAVYEVLKNADPTELVLLGGQLRRNYRSTVGYIAESAMSHLHANIAFLGTSGITRTGRVLDTTPVEVPVKQQIIQSSDRVVLLATARKFPGTGMSVVCGPEEVSILITTEDTDPSLLKAFANYGTEIIRV